jgi:hypothetical protein
MACFPNRKFLIMTSDFLHDLWYASRAMLKFAFVAILIGISSAVSLSSEALAASATPSFFFCRAGLNGVEKRHAAIITPETPDRVLEFGYGISSRLRLLKSGSLGIEVLHGQRVVSSMAMKRGTVQFAMTAGGIEMSCYPNINRDGF